MRHSVGSGLKVRADGRIVLSSYLAEGEEWLAVKEAAARSGDIEIGGEHIVGFGVKCHRERKCTTLHDPVHQKNTQICWWYLSCHF